VKKGCNKEIQSNSLSLTTGKYFKSIGEYILVLLMVFLFGHTFPPFIVDIVVYLESHHRKY